MSHFQSLRAQLAICTAILVMAIVGFSGIAITIQMDHRDRDTLDQQLQAQSIQISENIDALLTETATESDVVSSETFDDLLQSNATFARYISSSTVLAERGDRPEESPAIPTETGLSTITIDGESWRSLVIVPEATSSDQLQVLQNLTALDERLDSNRRLVAIVTIVATLVAGAAGWLLTSIIAEPLERLRRRALAIRTDGKLAERLPVPSNPQEVQDLATSINGLLLQLQTRTKSERRFTADAGRELRAPLTNLGTHLETLRRNLDFSNEQLVPALRSMTMEQRRMIALVDGLQKLARGDAGAVPAREHIDIAELLSYCVRQVQGRHPGVTYRVHPYEGSVAVVEGWADGLRLAIDNLLENAALHGNPRGRVDVELFADGRRIDIVVSDDGPGIPADQREPLKERFARGAQPRTEGSGLGLALVVQQAALHGGRLTLGEAAGGGLSATLTVRAFTMPSVSARGTRQDTLSKQIRRVAGL